MTARKSTLRPRRRTSAESLPRDLADWFAGEPRREDQSALPWSALVYPDYMLLRERWQIWKAAHPAAKPPAGFEWIAEPPPELAHGTPWDEAVAQARKCAQRGK